MSDETADAIKYLAERVPVPDAPVCPYCDHPVIGTDIAPTVLWVDGEPRTTHRSCSLREVIGGIGHLVAHRYWCVERHDPDAGLTRRQSALLADVYIAVVGIEPADGPEVPGA